MKTGLVLFALLLSLAGVASPAAAHDATPVAVEGDALTRLVRAHPGDPTLLAAGADGLFALGADDWTRLGTAPPEGQLVTSGGDIPVLLAGDHAACMMGGPGSPLQRSEDGGQTWTQVEPPIDLRPLAIWPEGGLALGASCEGLQLSTDLGVTWAPVPGIEPGWELTAFAEVAEPTVTGPVVLIGLTSEGGSTQLRQVDLSDPAAPVVSDILREYYAVGGLAAQGDTYVLAAMDGVWQSMDAGATWERSADGLEDVVLEEDPLVVGLPVDFDPEATGLEAAAFIPGSDALVVGSVDGLYLRAEGDTSWQHVEGTAGRVREVVVRADGTLALYRTDDGVFAAELSGHDH